MEKEQIFKIYHKPTGLFYCSKKGHYRDKVTNLSKKGNFYIEEKYAINVFDDACNGAYINKAQVKKYGLTINGDEMSYSKAKKEEFVIKEYVLEEVE